MNTLTIKDLKFDIISALLEPFFDDDDDDPNMHTLVWCVEIHAAQKGGPQEDWKPSFISEFLIETAPMEISTWQDLVGQKGEWEDDDEEMGLLTTFETEPVYNVKWEIKQAPSGRLLFTLKGISSFAHPGGYEGDLPVEIETELDFVRIPCGISSEEECRNQLKQFGITGEFKFQVVNEVSVLIPGDYPK
jgi:hypothetical protein